MITSGHLRVLHRTLVDAFDEDELRQLLFGLAVPAEYVGSADSPTRLFDAIADANRAGWVLDLVKAARDLRPQNEALAVLASELGLLPAVRVQATPGAAPVAWAVASDQGTTLGVDLAEWQVRVPDIAARVCRVEARGRSVGTGFLVGPDLVLTARDALGEVHRKEPSAIRCRFDHRVLADGTAEGWVIGLNAADPVAAESAEPADRPAGLACAVLRLWRAVGSELVGAAAAAPTPRGWLRLPDKEPAVRPGGPLVLVQSLVTNALQVIVGAGVVVDRDRSYLHHRLAVDALAVGAPCFDLRWNLVAVHLRSKDTADGPVGDAVRVGPLRKWLKKAGITAALGGEMDRPQQPPPEPGPVRVANDLQKKRWGGKSSRAGRKLSATITHVEARLFTCDFVVESTDGSPLEGPVVFHLHNSFPKMVVHIRHIRDGKRALLEDVIAYGAFTVGAQVKDSAGDWVGLEYDLVDNPDLPERFHDL